MPRREPESEEQRKSRLVRQKVNYLKRRYKETPEERQHRLRKMCESHKRKRRNESPEERTARLEKAKIKNMKYIQNETPEQRERRLNRLKSYYRQRLENETPEQRETRLMKGRISQKKKNVNETPERREKRLNKLRDYQKRKLENETPEQREYRLNRLKNNQKRRQTKDGAKHEESPSQDKDTRIEIAYLERQHLIDQHLLQDDVQNDNEDPAQKNQINDQSFEKPKNVLIKQELMIDDNSNGDKPQDVCLPVITCVKSEYYEFPSKEFDVQTANLKYEFESISYPENEDGIDIAADKSSDILSNIKEEITDDYSSFVDSADESRPEDPPKNESEVRDDLGENDLLVPRAVKIVNVVELESIKKTNNAVIVNNHGPLPELKCRICSKVFKYEKPFRRHETSHERAQELIASQKPVPINTDLPFTRSNTVQHKSESDTEPSKVRNGAKAECQCWCGKAYENNDGLIECIKIHGGFLCGLCPNAFRIKTELDVHKKRRHKEHVVKPFKCDVCPQSFAYQRVLSMHKKKHISVMRGRKKNGQNNVALNVSKKTVDDAPALNTPVVVEVSKETQTEHVCQVCNETFPNEKSLVKHRGSHTSSLMYRCDKCDFISHNTKGLVLHKRLHCSDDAPRGEKRAASRSLSPADRLQYTCDICGRQFNSQVQMIRHKNTHPFITFAEDDLTQKQIFYK